MGRKASWALVALLALTMPVETVTVHADTASGSATLRLHWETTRISLPLAESP